MKYSASFVWVSRVKKVNPVSHIWKMEALNNGCFEGIL